MDAARVEFDEAKRNELFHRFQRVLYDDQPYTFMLANPALIVVSKRFDNVIVHNAGVNVLEWKVKR
jgi:peptide/nickel transport system substrate-binding protein